MTTDRDSARISEALARLFPQLTEPELLGIISRQARWQTFAAGQTLLTPGQPIGFLPLLAEGTVQLFRADAQGRELFLYFLHPGETCAITLQCCRPGASNLVRATAEEDGAFIALPNRFVEAFIQDFASFRNLVIDTYARRFDALLDALDAVAFNKLDERLLQYLRELTIARNSRTLRVTHQEIAESLATTREVVSRLLKQLERLGKVKLLRQQIEVCG
jgi:CRP/FNR family transcriptional regulator, anaerobic regulatory protein